MEGVNDLPPEKDIKPALFSVEVGGLISSVRRGTIIESKEGYKDKPEDLARLDSDRARLVEYYERKGKKVAPIVALHSGLMSLINDEEWKELSEAKTNEEEMQRLIRYFGAKRQQQTKPQEV